MCVDVQGRLYGLMAILQIAVHCQGHQSSRYQSNPTDGIMVLPVDYRTQFPDRSNSGMSHIDAQAKLPMKKLLSLGIPSRRGGRECGEADTVLCGRIGILRTII